LLYVPEKIVDEIIKHALEASPIEACGFAAGWQGSLVPSRLIRMRNTLESAVEFAFDPDEQLKEWQKLDENGEDPLLIYHSHVAAKAYPSNTDIQNAFYPDLHYVIVSVPERRLKSFRIADWTVTEEDVILLR
jgi:proteasome lid subunit RPN8/RPN11